MIKFAGRTVFISGAGSGIGYQTALHFAKAGARIVATDIQQSGLDALRQEIEQSGGACRTAILNVTDESATEVLVEELQASQWLPDIAVNNAGIVYVMPFLETETEVWRKTLDVNVMGVAIGSRVFAQAWQKAGIKGHLVNVSSMVSVMPQPSLSAYVASKYAVEGMCESLAIELKAHGIDVTCIHPGVINTPIIGNPSMVKMSEAQFEALKHHYETDGIAPAEVGKAIVESTYQKKTNAFIGPQTGLAVLMKRFLPRTWYRSLIESTARRIGYTPR